MARIELEIPSGLTEEEWKDLYEALLRTKIAWEWYNDFRGPESIPVDGERVAKYATGAAEGGGSHGE